MMGGDDANTTAAVRGAISGAYKGEGTIPLRWCAYVARGEETRAMARELWELQSRGTTRGASPSAASS